MSTQIAARPRNTCNEARWWRGGDSAEFMKARIEHAYPAFASSYFVRAAAGLFVPCEGFYHFNLRVETPAHRASFGGSFKERALRMGGGQGNDDIDFQFDDSPRGVGAHVFADGGSHSGQLDSFASRRDRHGCQDAGAQGAANEIGGG